jgi:hypothetical protein
MFKSAVGNVVKFQVKFTLKEGLLNKQFAFTLTGVRKEPDELELESEKTIKSALLECLTDWADQRLVLLENNEPAPFSPEAVEYLAVKHPSVLLLFWAAYQRECGCKEKN